jgi:hypothetical protein
LTSIFDSSTFSSFVSFCFSSPKLHFNQSGILSSSFLELSSIFVKSSSCSFVGNFSSSFSEDLSIEGLTFSSFVSFVSVFLVSFLSSVFGSSTFSSFFSCCFSSLKLHFNQSGTSLV